jgi:alkylated DNA repair dioxygenase AlkB
MKHERIEMPDADVVLFPTFFSAEQSDMLLESLARRIVWNQEKINRFGRTIDRPRLTAWYGEEGLAYTYSGITHRAVAWTSDLLEIKNSVESIANTSFNSVLLNRYRDGRDSVSWHSDDERALGTNPVIASVSLGQTRRFQFKHRQHGQLRESVELAHGSLLLMQGATQHHWLHQIPKTKRPVGERINLTFRIIVPNRSASNEQTLAKPQRMNEKDEN